MTYRHCLLILIALCEPFACSSAQPPAASATSVKPVITVSKTPYDPFLDVLNGTMAGQRVLAVSTGSSSISEPPAHEELAKEKTLLGKLQLLSAAYSANDESLIPFAVRKTWVIAPATRDEVNTDLSKMTVLDAASRGLLFMHFLGQVTPEEAAKLGTDDGLAVSELNDGLQNLMARVLQPPMLVEDALPDVNDPSFSPSKNRVKGRISTPIDLSKVHLRARLAVGSITITSGDTAVERLLSGDAGTVLEEISVRPQSDQSSLDLPVLHEVPNTFKLSDLQGRSLTKPIGVSGIKTVADTVELLSSLTDLKLHSGTMFGPVRVFIGNPDIECGEVIDGLRLALTASWRRVGAEYVLTWDRRGLGGLQLKVAEQARRIVDLVQKRNDDTLNDEGWAQLAAKLPFDSTDPFAPTEEQRKRLSQRPGDSDANAGIVRFADMTPAQQEAARKIVTEPGQMPSIGSADDPSSERSLNESDLPNTSLRSRARVILYVSIPGSGWVRIPESWGNGTTRQFSCDLVPPIQDKETPEAAEKPERTRTIVLNAVTRGLMVPPLASGRLADLAAMMKRHGLNTLFYPALYGGYATFPSRSFPLHPTVAVANGWKAAVQAMAPLGIKVIGYVSVLAWQQPENRAHWINKYPEWIDRDALGRTRLQWLDQNPALTRPPLFSVFGDSVISLTAEPVAITPNYVRITEPNVTRRLESFVDEFTRQLGSSGIAFVDWLPFVADSQDRATPPSMGCAMADRMLAIKDTGDDPIDDATEDWTFRPRLVRRLTPSSDDWRQPEAPTPDAPEEPHLALAVKLAERATAARKDWKSLLLDDAGWLPQIRGRVPKKAKLPFDVRLQGLGSDRSAEYSGLILPIWPHDAKIEPAPMADRVGKPAMLTYADYWKMLGINGSRTKSIVLDMREAPGDIAETLAILKPPSATKPRPAVWTSGTTNSLKR